MLLAVLIAQVVIVILLGVLAVFAFKAWQLGNWCQDVCIPWMVTIANLLHDDYNPPPPPTPPGPG